MKMKCSLCKAEELTHWYINTKEFWIADCLDCNIPMLVWKEHVKDFPKGKREELIDFVKKCFGNHVQIRWLQRKIKDHAHLHIKNAKDEDLHTKIFSEDLIISSDVAAITPRKTGTIPRPRKKKREKVDIIFGKTISDLTLLHAFAHHKKNYVAHNLLVDVIKKEGYPHYHVDECDSHYDLIKNWKSYNPKNISDAVLRDDWRIVNAWWKNILSKGKAMKSEQFKEYSLERQKQIVKSLMKKIGAEMKKRGWEPKELCSISNKDVEPISEEELEPDGEYIKLEDVLKAFPPAIVVDGQP